jgi:hypothetical protein
MSLNFGRAETNSLLQHKVPAVVAYGSSKRDLPAGIPNRIVQIFKRVRHFPIWIMGPNFPDNYWSMFDQLRPSMQNDKIIGIIAHRAASRLGTNVIVFSWPEIPGV